MPSKRAKRTKSDARRYDEFLRKLDLVAIGLVSTSSHLDRSPYMKLNENKKNRLRSITASYKLADAEKDFFNAMARLKLTVQDKKTGLEVLVIKCEFVTHFHGRRPIQKAFAERFANSEYRLIVWPYFRQFVTDMTARMYIQPLTLPLSTQKP